MIWHHKVRSATVHYDLLFLLEVFAAAQVLSRIVCFHYTPTAKLYVVKLNGPKILTSVIMPSEVLNGELISVIPAKCRVTYIFITGKAEREDSF